MTEESISTGSLIISSHFTSTQWTSQKTWKASGEHYKITSRHSDAKNVRVAKQRNIVHGCQNSLQNRNERGENIHFIKENLKFCP